MKTLPFGYRTTEDLLTEKRAFILYAVCTKKMITEVDLKIVNIKGDDWIVFQTDEKQAISIHGNTIYTTSFEKHDSPPIHGWNSDSLSSKDLHAAEIAYALSTNKDKNSPLYRKFEEIKNYLYRIYADLEKEPNFYQLSTMRPRKDFSIRQAVFHRHTWQYTWKGDNNQIDLDSIGFILLKETAKKYGKRRYIYGYFLNFYTKAKNVLFDFHTDLTEFKYAYSLFEPLQLLKEDTFKEVNKHTFQIAEKMIRELQKRTKEALEFFSEHHCHRCHAGETCDECNSSKETISHSIIGEMNQRIIDTQRLFHLFYQKEKLAAFNIYNREALLSFIRSHGIRLEKELTTLQSSTPSQILRLYHNSRFFIEDLEQIERKFTA